MSRVSPNPSAQPARDELCAYADRYGYTEHVNALIDAFRAEVLAEAVEAARSEYLRDNTGTPEDEAYNQGVSDAVAAIGALVEGGESR
ncbi:hypothetical protein ACGF3K_14250 [Streptomyces sp. NPDC047980]|uniref:hypothetical protein n=1 Tax=Streptomyces sp. NPDC047980 TaxID=3365494 RepID=UPI0037135945